MQFPNDIQTALLFDRPVAVLENAVKTFIRIMEARTGQRFNMPEVVPGTFYRLFGCGELMVTAEYLNSPPDVEKFRGPLQSPVTGTLCSDIRERVVRSQAHILLNVSHGALGSVLERAEFAKFLANIDYPRPGANLAQFRERIDVLTLFSRIVADLANPTAVHWVQSDQLISGEKFELYAQGSSPGPLHIHPYLFGPCPAPGEEQATGIRTFGARHFIGRELLVEPSTLPWAAQYQVMFAFLNLALAPGGYIIPDGDTFGDENRTTSYRVLHRDAEEGDVLLSELVPLHLKECNYKAADFTSYENRIDDRAPPPELMPEGDDQKMALVNEWQETRRLAEGAGVKFEVRTRQAPPPRPSDPPENASQMISGSALRAKLFGRKGLS